MTASEAFVLLAAGGVAGIASTAASVASVVSYPVLLAPPGAFAVVVPVLIGGASVLLLMQPLMSGLAPRPGAEQSWRHLTAMFCGAIYLGYFGAAGGVLLLAILGTMLAEPLVRVNAIKNAISGTANGVAAVIFAIFAPVHWSFVPLLAVGFLIGGITGPWLIRRLPTRALRVFVALCGLALAVKLGISAYR